MRERPSTAEVRQYRESHECSIQEAVSHCMTEWRRGCLHDIRAKAGELYTVDQCRDVIVDLLDLLAED